MLHLRLPVLQEIRDTAEVQDESGKRYKLHSEISPEEGELIHSLITQHQFANTLEIGCAFGISSLYICDALSRQTSPHHTILDPMQSVGWHGIGMNNLKRAGFHFFELIEKPSEIALPMLLAEGKKFQFALIDGWHTFDHTLLDFFYVNRLLEEGGIVVIDDVHMPAVTKVARYIVNYPNYKLLTPTSNAKSSYGYSTKRRMVDGAIRFLTKMLPRSYVDEVFSDSWRRPDSSLIGNRSMIALQKTAPDERTWDWYAPF